jgi:hypothetical protein
MVSIHFRMNHPYIGFFFLVFFRHIFIEAQFINFRLNMIPIIDLLMVQLFRLVIEGGGGGVMLDCESLENHKV